MVKNIVFDYGKVLLDWNPHYLFDDYFRDPEKCERFLDIISRNNEWFNDGDIGTPMAEVVQKWSARYPEFAEAFRFYISHFDNSIRTEVPGMYDLICNLKERGYKVWGLSNWSWELFQQIQPRYRIFTLLDGMVISGKVHLIKPDPAIYRHFLDEFGLNAQECVFTDDRQVNLDGAAEVGIRGILFQNAEQFSVELEALLSSDKG